MIRYPFARRCAAIVVIWAITAIVAGLPAAMAAEPKLVPLVRSMKWSHVSGLIGYRGRLWFANSVKYVNHNSADLYSYDPATGNHRYERHMFSQDAGDPVVHRGLLYWPFEDSRWSPGNGEFMVTNGTDWRWGLLPEGQAFHVHTMVSHKGALYAAPSAWRTHIQRSDDLGESWKRVYEYPSPARAVARITSLGNFNGALYAGLTTWSDKTTPKLLRLTGATFKPIGGWPVGTSTTEITPFRGWLYGYNDNGDEVKGGTLWRTDGRRVEQIQALDWTGLRALAAGPDALWAVFAHQRGGTLWRSPDGITWDRVQRFSDAWPSSVAVFGGRVYVGARGADGGGVLFGPQAPAPMVSAVAGPPPPLPRRGSGLVLNAGDALAALDRTLGDTMNRRNLRGMFLPLARSRDPALGQGLAERLIRDYPLASVLMFGGRAKVPGHKFARWYMMWAMAHNGHGRVPPALIRTPFEAPRNRAEKYLEPAPGAAWAAAILGQNDRETLNSLVGRLSARNGPDWIEGDMIGALTALTGQRFGYDVGAWTRWWERRK